MRWTRSALAALEWVERYRGRVYRRCFVTHITGLTFGPHLSIRVHMGIDFQGSLQEDVC